MKQSKQVVLFRSTAIFDFEELGKTNPFYAELDRICKKNNGIWSVEAEKYLLEKAKKI